MTSRPIKIVISSFCFACVLGSRHPVTAASGDPTPTGTKGPPVATAAEVRRLLFSDLPRAAEARITGIVTYVDLRDEYFVVQDHTRGIPVDCGPAPPVKAGDRITVEGPVAVVRGMRAVSARRIRHLSHGPLPPPRRVTAEALLSGQYEGELVEVQGVVWSAGRESNRSDTTDRDTRSRGQGRSTPGAGRSRTGRTAEAGRPRERRVRVRLAMVSGQIKVDVFLARAPDTLPPSSTPKSSRGAC